MKRAHRLAAVATIAVLVLAACGEDEPGLTDAPTSSPESIVQITPESPEPSPKPETVRVPRFIGMKLREARSLARDRGLQLEVITKAYLNPRSTVFGQRPAPHSPRQPGAVVRVSLSLPEPSPVMECQGYSPCIEPGPDVDCAGGSGDGPRYVDGPITVTGTDPYGLDGDSNGVGCE
jgi:hypothetical protein